MLTDAKIAAIKPPAVGQAEYSDAKVTGLRLRVGTGGAKTWILRRRVGPKVINKKIGTYPATGLGGARTAALELLEALERDGSTAALDRTFGQFAADWIERVAKLKNRHWKLQERQLELHVLPKWKDRRLADVRRADVRELIEGLEGDVLPNRVLALIKTIFRAALERDLIEASPAEGVRKTKAEATRDRVLTMAEIKQVWDAAGLLGYPFGPFIRVLLLTGQRRTEIAQMRWAAVDLEGGTFALRGEEAKNERGHIVPLSEPVRALLAELPEMGDYVFTSNGKSPVSGFARAKSGIDAFIAAKGGVEPWRLHDLRRSAATHMVRLGVTMEVVGRVLNHAPAGITAKVYGLHEFAPEKRNALDRWAAEVMRAVTGEGGEKVVSIRG